MNLNTPETGEWEGAQGNRKISSYGVARESHCVSTRVASKIKDVKNDTGNND